MAVKPESLDNRETPTVAAVADAGAELAALRRRIAAARTLEPGERDRHCLDCFQRGRDAAIRAILGET